MVEACWPQRVRLPPLSEFQPRIDTNEHQFKAVLQKEAKGTKVFVLKVSASFPSVEKSSCEFVFIRG
jgi:hypothetical protein